MIGTGLLLIQLCSGAAVEHDALKRAAALEAARVQQAPDDTQALYRLGLAYLALGEAAKAVAPLKALVQKDDEAIDGKILLSNALPLSRQAKEILASAAKSSLGETEAHYNLGVILMREGNAIAAIGAFQRTIAVNPKHSPAHNNLGVAFDALGDHPRASAEFKKAIEGDPSYAPPPFNLRPSSCLVVKNRTAT